MRNTMSIAIVVLSLSAGAASAGVLDSSSLNSSAAATAACTATNFGAPQTLSVAIFDQNGKAQPLYTGAPNCGGTVAKNASCFNYAFVTAGSSYVCTVTFSAASGALVRGHFELNDSNNQPVAFTDLR